MDQFIRQRLLKILEEICESIEDQSHKNLKIGVLSGISGVSLFYFYYSKLLNADQYYTKGINILEESIDRINLGYSFPTYCSGIAGFGWVLDHVVEEKFVETDTDGLLSDLDGYLYQVMTNDLKKKYYDFLHGAIGYGYYFLKRYKNTKSDILKKRYTDYLFFLVSSLKQLSEKDKNGIKWSSVLNKKTGQQGYNLSLSHGMSSIINFLSRLYLFEEFKLDVLPLLKGAISYVLSFENLDKNAFSLFPNWITNPADHNSSRLAWCYGDLGIGLTLRIASKALKDKYLGKKSLQILVHSANRKTFEESLVKDAGLCHGSYGNAQIYNRLYRETQNNIFREAAIHWIEKSISLSTFKDGYAGYKTWSGPDKMWTKETNLLTGIAGIGLAIIFHLSDLETTWDECLMIV